MDKHLSSWVDEADEDESCSSRGPSRPPNSKLRRLVCRSRELTTASYHRSASVNQLCADIDLRGKSLTTKLRWSSVISIQTQPSEDNSLRQTSTEQQSDDTCEYDENMTRDCRALHMALQAPRGLESFARRSLTDVKSPLNNSNTTLRREDTFVNIKIHSEITSKKNYSSGTGFSTPVEYRRGNWPPWNRRKSAPSSSGKPGNPPLLQRCKLVNVFILSLPLIIVGMDRWPIAHHIGKILCVRSGNCSEIVIFILANQLPLAMGAIFVAVMLNFTKLGKSSRVALMQLSVIVHILGATIMIAMNEIALLCVGRFLQVWVLYV